MTLKDKKMMAPLWLEFPKAERGSIGWRMGNGEGYAYKFWDWYESLTVEEKEEYKNLFPEPFDWKGAYEGKDESEMLLYGEYFFVYAWNLTYGKEWLEKELKEGNKKEFFVFSDGLNPAEGKICEECLGLTWIENFDYIARGYRNIKEYLLCEKARLFDDEEAEAQINEALLTDLDTLEVNIKDYDEKVWKKYFPYILLNGLYRKFFSNKDLREYLLSTGDSVLVYADCQDTVNGIRLPKDSMDIKDPKKWKGENLLGFGLMMVRDEIRRITKNEELLEK